MYFASIKKCHLCIFWASKQRGKRFCWPGKLIYDHVTLKNTEEYYGYLLSIIDRV